MELIGWVGHAKPVEMRHGMADASQEPHIPEYEEVNLDLGKGIEITSGYRHEEELPAKYDADGVLLPQPFDRI